MAVKRLVHLELLSSFGDHATIHKVCHAIMMLTASLPCIVQLRLICVYCWGMQDSKVQVKIGPFSSGVFLIGPSKEQTIDRIWTGNA